MKTTSRFYIIPGMGESAISKRYKEMRKFSAKKGFEVVPIKVVWEKSMIIDDFIKQVLVQLPKTTKKDYILGFSMGAYITAIISKKKKFKGILFCDTSPYFKEYLKILEPKNKKYLGERLWNNLKKYSFPKNVSTPAWFLLGLKGDSMYTDIMNKFPGLWRGQSKTILLKGVGHDIAHKKYINAIKNIIKHETHL